MTSALRLQTDLLANMMDVACIIKEPSLILLEIIIDVPYLVFR